MKARTRTQTSKLNLLNAHTESLEYIVLELWSKFKTRVRETKWMQEVPHTSTMNKLETKI